MKRKLILATGLVLMAWGALYSLAIPLAVKNQVAQARNDVPVQMGVPFPQGKLLPADLSKLTISDSATGQAVPAGIASTVNWHDGSVRWIRVMFPATVASAGSKTYMLTDANKNPGAGLTAVAGTNTVTVVTGPLKFTVKGANFNLIDEAWMNEAAPGVFGDPQKVIAAGNTGGFTVKIGGTTYNSNTVTATVTLYEQSSYHAIIRASGRIGSYPFVIYYYAYAGKPYVKVVHRFYYDNADGSSASLINIGDLALTLKTALTTGGTATFSSANGDGDTATTVAGAEEAYLHYGVEDYYLLRKGTAKLDSGGGMNLSPSTYGSMTMGWGHLSNGSLGVAGAIRYMWQMAPKNISLLGNGDVALHLYSNKGATMQYYGGAGRTHFTGFAFTTSPAMAKEMFYAVTQPLYAQAPPKWLTAQTKVAGNLVPCDATVFSANYATIIYQYKQMGVVHGHNQRRAIVDNENSYGFVGFGDLSDPPESCGDRHWSNNYYDFPHNIGQAYLMCGDVNNIETGLMHALQLGDLDHSNVTGQSRTCPGWGNFGDYTACAIGYSGTSNHYKCAGLFEWSNILAEPILGEMGLIVAKWAQGYVGGEIRAVGHVLMALSAAYAYTNSATWKTYLEGCYAAMSVVGNFTGQPFQQAFVGEAIMWTLLEDPTYPSALAAMEQWADHWAGVYDTTANTFGDYPDLACGYFSGLSYAADLFPAKAATYNAVLADLWNVWSTVQGPAGDGRLKTFTQKFKASPHYFHHIKAATYDPMTPDYWAATTSVVALEKQAEAVSVSGDLSAAPNPGNPDITLSYSVMSGSAAVPVSMVIFNAAGQKVCALVNDFQKSGAYRAVWSGRDSRGQRMPSGVYLVRLKAGNLKMEKKIILAR